MSSCDPVDIGEMRLQNVRAGVEIKPTAPLGAPPGFAVFWISTDGTFNWNGGPHIYVDDVDQAVVVSPCARTASARSGVRAPRGPK